MPRRRSNSSLLPLDRWALSLMLGLALVIGGLVLSGDHALARVRDFSWQERQVGAEDRAFLVTFSRPMDPASVEQNLEVSPPLPGKFSWAGRRMAYTLDVPAPYGETFTVTLNQAKDRFAVQEQRDARFQAFQSTFQTRNRALAYIGAEGDETGRLVLADLTQQARRALTPPDLVVLDFKPYPLGDRILFAATEAAAYRQGKLEQKLYTVTTGLNPKPPKEFGATNKLTLRTLFRRSSAPQPSGKVELVLDNQDYQNLKFDLSPDGKVIVVQRLNKNDPADFKPWIVEANKPPRKLEAEEGGEFLIAPDSQSLVMLQGQGTAIIPLNSEEQAQNNEPLDFLPNYGRVFDLSNDGSSAAMVNFNQNDPNQRFTESLFLVTNEGVESKLMQVTGKVHDAQFDPTNRTLYTLTSELLPGKEYVEQPVLSAITLADKTVTDLLILPAQQTISMNLAPDGLALVLTFEGVQSDGSSLPPEVQATTNTIWLLPLYSSTEERLQAKPIQNQPEPMPFKGVQATWLP
ncbi:MAG TPA: Ig-like domain-containing protein [Leptolyngbyaceae cyanobacterium]